MAAGRTDPSARVAGAQRRWPRLQSAPFRLAVVAASMAAIAALDLLADHVITGLNLFVFYFVPVALAAWGGGRNEGLAVALAGSAVWFAVEYVESDPVAHLWNTGVRGVAFTVVALSVARISELLARERQLNDELRESMRTVRQLGGLLPICGACKSIRNDQGYWERLEHFIESHSEAEFSHGLCPKCAERLEREADEPPF
jgi:K+-sensing histidine kinase KdpD